MPGGMTNIMFALRRLRRRLLQDQGWQRLRKLDLRAEKTTPLHRKALVSYVVHAFSMQRDDPRYYQHINVFHSQEMVRVLNELGYAVDVVSYHDTDFVPKDDYRLFVGHGGFNFQRIAAQLPASATRVYFSTGCYWRFHNEQEMARLEALHRRRGILLPPDRLIRDDEEGALREADGVLGIGNGLTAQTYSAFSPVIMLNGTALSDDHYERQVKDLRLARQHFLYFAGPGCVHKGLDLLLEAFASLEQAHLWVCSKIDDGFGEVYADALQERPNIHLVGWVQPRSPEFYEVVDRCAYAILVSCSEGQAQSVVECMNQGLIPVVSLATGVDVEGFGFVLSSCDTDEIARAVMNLTRLRVEQCQLMSAKARQTAVTHYSEAAFRRNFKVAVQTLAEEVPRTRGA